MTSSTYTFYLWMLIVNNHMLCTKKKKHSYLPNYEKYLISHEKEFNADT